MLKFTGERIVPGAENCEPNFARKMYQEHVLRYALAARYAKDGDVLDMGCGVGYGARFLADNGARSVLAIDVAADALEHARCEYAHPAITFERRSAMAVADEDRFDLITCFEMIEHIDQQEKVVANAARALKQDGVLAISTPRPHKAMRSAFHVHELAPDEFVALVGRHFRHVTVLRQNNYIGSIIAEATPRALNDLILLENSADLGSCDYVVVLATNAVDRDLGGVEPIMTLNDFAYVDLLEHDVAVLHAAEDDLKRRLAVLETDEGINRATLDDAQRQLAAASAGMAEAQARAGRLEEELEVATLLHSTALATATAAQTALTERNAALASATGRAERAESFHRHELGEAQRLHVALAEHSAALTASLVDQQRYAELHAHELGQAQLLHKALQQRTDECDALAAALSEARALHMHELGEARRLHEALAQCDADRAEARREGDEAARVSARLQEENTALAAEIQRLLDRRIEPDRATWASVRRRLGGGTSR